MKIVLAEFFPDFYYYNDSREAEIILLFKINYKHILYINKNVF